MKISPSTIGLGVTMTIGYGTLYYSFAVLAPEIAGEFGWEESFVFAIFSIGLLAGAISAPIIGRMIDRFGARSVMSAGSLFAATTLALIAVMQNAWQFTVLALMAEFVAIAVQYDAGFAALAQRYGRNARAEITLVTLIAGFASTVFWPLIQWLLTQMTWREVYLVLAAMNLLIALPIHLTMPKGRLTPPEMLVEPNALALVKSYQHVTGSRPMILLGISLASGGFVLSAIGASLLILLDDIGFATATATIAASCIGPSQVAARLFEYARRSHFSPPMTAIIAASAMVLGLALLGVTLLALVPAFLFAFAVMYGVGQGLTSIVRGMLPLHYFGPEGYGRRTGTLSGFRMVLSASAPFTIIFLNERLGTATAIGCLVALSLLSLISLLALVRFMEAPEAA
ncbi:MULTISPECIES: MFS transporter [Hoeflea]|uniref:MFS transporter n=2 Tax=Hoeflea alexandrii TaxID=288436 RepID=A0ABT1CS93_9HYPH|nr:MULTISPECIES: MFS transporter [Hoeflea]MCO6409083.1 MFS transporter [Hoeflea alexandrii]VVT29471.1 MFS transporter [Hoeflea sp. EC-HK425]